MLELRAFQRITDLLGHDVGDRVLMTVADALRREVGEAGMVARLSGDQFLVALDDVRSGDEAGRFGRRLAEAVDAAALESELPGTRTRAWAWPARPPTAATRRRCSARPGAALHRAEASAR